VCVYAHSRICAMFPFCEAFLALSKYTNTMTELLNAYSELAMYLNLCQVLSHTLFYCSVQVATILGNIQFSWPFF
jgi:hypothetical protein